MLDSLRRDMALTPNHIAELLKLRALGWSQSEIAERLITSHKVMVNKLKKLTFLISFNDIKSYSPTNS